MRWHINKILNIIILLLTYLLIITDYDLKKYKNGIPLWICTDCDRSLIVAGA